MASAFPPPREWLNGISSAGMPDLSTRDYVYCLGLDFDVDSQFQAIRSLLARNAEAEKSHADEIKLSDREARELSGIWNDYAVERHISLLHASTYQDAAHSMAAVGMLAPFIETIFDQCFRGIGRQYFPSAAPSGGHERWIQAHTIEWDCHNVILKGRVQKDLVRGIRQLAEAIGIWASFPSDVEMTLDALIGYRNKMFHCGFEWPVDERAKFRTQIDQSKWPATWFARAESGGEPWIFYMTNEFIEQCLSIADQVLVAFGGFVRDVLLPNKQPADDVRVLPGGRERAAI